MYFFRISDDWSYVDGSIDAAFTIPGSELTVLFDTGLNILFYYPDKRHVWTIPRDRPEIMDTVDAAYIDNGNEIFLFLGWYILIY